MLVKRLGKDGLFRYVLSEYNYRQKAVILALSILVLFFIVRLTIVNVREPELTIVEALNTSIINTGKLYTEDEVVKKFLIDQCNLFVEPEERKSSTALDLACIRIISLNAMEFRVNIERGNTPAHVQEFIERESTSSWRQLIDMIREEHF